MSLNFMGFAFFLILTFFSQSMALLDEDCIEHETSALEVKEIGDAWSVLDGSSIIFSFESIEEAEKALKVMKDYQTDKRCFVGRPDASMAYFLADGQSPIGAIEGENCQTFNPDQLELNSRGGGWVIDHETEQLLRFENASEAGKALDIILEYRFQKLCYLTEEQDPGFSYFARNFPLRPDLVVSNVEVLDYTAGEIEIAYTVTNQGEAAADLSGGTETVADDMVMHAYLSLDSTLETGDDPEAGWVRIQNPSEAGLLPGDSVTGVFTGSLEGDPAFASNPFLILEVDKFDRVDESNEGNNLGFVRYRNTANTSRQALRYQNDPKHAVFFGQGIFFPNNPKSRKIEYINLLGQK